MPDANPQDTLDTNASEYRLNRFESAWRAGGTPPDWRQHLPADEGQRGPAYISDLLQMDIEYRIKAGLPALLAEHYFEHPRLQKDDARSTDEQQVELIRWEYQLRWQNGQRPSRAEYEAAFPQHAEAVRQMKPQWRCPRCRKVVVLEETQQTLACPDCRGESSVDSAVAPIAAESAATQFDLRDYELIEALKAGGMGEVYRSSDPALGRDLAIKVMKSDDRGYAEAERRFLREARVTGSLQHPGIVPVYNLGRLTDGRVHYTMRLVRGQTFADILKEEAGKPERLPSLLSIFEKICQAVAYAHSKRVIHRDLKPQNVMVGNFGEVQVIDWGLAKVLTPEEAADDPEEKTDIAGTRMFTESAATPVDLSRTGLALGTFQYMPSEQARGKWNAVDERADVFALGSILCEILTGQPAYIGASSSELIDRVERGDVTETLQRLQQCGADAALTALCRECLSSHREDRPRDASVVAKRVAEYQAAVQERLRRAELERVAAETRAREEQARALVEQERTREALARVKAERQARRRLLVLAAAVAVFVIVGAVGLLERMRTVRAEQRRTQQALDQVTREQQNERLLWNQMRSSLNRLTDYVLEELLDKPTPPNIDERIFLLVVLGFYLSPDLVPNEDKHSLWRGAESHFRVAKARAFLGQAEEAEKNFRTAVRLFEKLVGDGPDQLYDVYQSELALSQNGLGKLLARLGRQEEAEATYRQALALQQKLVDASPDRYGYRVDLANSYVDFGDLVRDRGQPESALDW